MMSGAPLRKALLRSLLRENPFQPATSWWRSIELAVVIEHGLHLLQRWQVPWK